MIRTCEKCQWTYDDEFRWTICPHDTFAANDGNNNHAHHPESHLSPPLDTAVFDVDAKIEWVTGRRGQIVEDPDIIVIKWDDDERPQVFSRRYVVNYAKVVTDDRAHS